MIPKKHTRHPPSLSVFFATEMWERYGFYALQTLLVLYLAFHFHWQDERVYSLVGTFTGLTYLSPLVGGWIADKLLGQKYSIIVGAVILGLSYTALFLFPSERDLLLALSGVAVGAGLLKPNISSLLGHEYPMDSPYRDMGFTIFYMGIVSGILMGTLIPSQLNYYFGWPMTFGSAAIGMLIALAIFILGAYYYDIQDYCPRVRRLSDCLKAAGIIFISGAISFLILRYPTVADAIFLAVTLYAMFYFFLLIQRSTIDRAKQIKVIGLLCIISILFWAFYFQMFLSLTLLIKRIASPSLGGILFPPPYYVCIQSLGIIVLGYLISRKSFFSQNPKRDKPMTTENKFLLAMVFMLFAYTLITVICYKNIDTQALLSPLYFIPAYLMISIAELLLSPTGLAAVTALASNETVSTLVGIFFASLGVGAFLSGKLADLTAINPELISLIQLKIHYANTLKYLLFFLIVSTLICVLLNRIIKSLLRVDHNAPH